MAGGYVRHMLQESAALWASLESVQPVETPGVVDVAFCFAAITACQQTRFYINSHRGSHQRLSNVAPPSHQSDRGSLQDKGRRGRGESSKATRPRLRGSPLNPPLWPPCRTSLARLLLSRNILTSRVLISFLFSYLSGRHATLVVNLLRLQLSNQQQLFGNLFSLAHAKALFLFSHSSLFAGAVQHEISFSSS